MFEMKFGHTAELCFQVSQISFFFFTCNCHVASVDVVIMKQD